MKCAAVIMILVLPVFATPGEEYLLEAHENAFRTSPEVLCIITEQGDTVTFQNRRETKVGLESACYYLIDFLPEVSFWTVEMHGYEWMEWYAVSSATGASTTTIGPPVPSPDGSRLLCLMEDIDAGFIHNGIQVWRINPDGTLRLEFEDIDVPWGPRNGEWRNDSTITFEKLAYDYDSFEYFSRPGKLKLNGEGVWEPPDPEDWDWP